MSPLFRYITKNPINSEIHLSAGLLPADEADDQQQVRPGGQLPEGVAPHDNPVRLLQGVRQAQALPLQVPGDQCVRRAAALQRHSPDRVHQSAQDLQVRRPTQCAKSNRVGFAVGEWRRRGGSVNSLFHFSFFCIKCPGERPF